MSDYLTVKRIEFSVTYRCNSTCRHCHVEEGDRRSRPAAIDRDLAAHIVHQVACAYPVDSVMTFGGEPLLYPDVTCAIHSAAQARGVRQRQIITNAGVPRSEARSRSLAQQLVANGVNDIAISVDGFHQEHIPLAIVERNARAYVEAGIARVRWNPCWVVSSQHDNPWNERTRSVLRTLAHLPIETGSGNVVQPDGNARTGLAEVLPARVPHPTGTCGDMPYTGRLDEISSITVEPDGRVGVCSDFYIGVAGGVTGGVAAAGNADQRDILEILESYDPYRVLEMRALLEGGVSALAQQAREQGISLDAGGYYHVCDMCVSLRRAMAGKPAPGTAVG
jgi:MoaA/NifB/PqqE/SkfB family radical SAM enzyme